MRLSIQSNMRITEKFRHKLKRSVYLAKQFGLTVVPKDYWFLLRSVFSRDKEFDQDLECFPVKDTLST
jgi:uncharacterized protein YwgA